jgi:hypothetical protein
MIQKVSPTWANSSGACMQSGILVMRMRAPAASNGDRIRARIRRAGHASVTQRAEFSGASLLGSHSTRGAANAAAFHIRLQAPLEMALQKGL